MISGYGMGENVVLISTVAYLFKVISEGIELSFDFQFLRICRCISVFARFNSRH